MGRDITAEIEKCQKRLLYLPSQAPEPLIPSVATYPMQKIDSDIFEVNGTKHGSKMVP